jgi:hypothetical protein
MTDAERLDLTETQQYDAGFFDRYCHYVIVEYLA